MFHKKIFSWTDDSEILELKSQLLAEQNAKNDLQVKLQNTENECE